MVSVSSNSLAVRNRLVEDHLGLVKVIAGIMFSRMPRLVDLDTLVSDGYIGLMQAAEKFDTSQGVKFTTYAQRRIRGAMLDAARVRDWVPRLQREQEKQGIVPERNIRFHSLDAPCGLKEDGTPRRLGEFLPDGSTEKDQLESREGLHRLIHGLPEQMRHVLILYYQEDLTMEEIGEALGVSQSRISQVHSQALDRIRKRMGIA